MRDHTDRTALSIYTASGHSFHSPTFLAKLTLLQYSAKVLSGNAAVPAPPRELVPTFPQSESSSRHHGTHYLGLALAQGPRAAARTPRFTADPVRVHEQRTRGHAPAKERAGHISHISHHNHHHHHHNVLLNTSQ